MAEASNISISQSTEGPVINFEGKVAIQLKGLSGYSNSSSSTGNYIDDNSNVFIGDYPTNVPTIGTPWGGQLNPISTPLITFPIPSVLAPPPLQQMKIQEHYKGCFYNREDFAEFITRCKNKVLIFNDMGEEKLVDKKEALKFVFFHFLAARKYKNWDDFMYKDDEWCIFFREAKTAPELLEAFDFEWHDIKEILCL